MEPTWAYFREGERNDRNIFIGKRDEFVRLRLNPTLEGSLPLTLRDIAGAVGHPVATEESSQLHDSRS